MKLFKVLPWLGAVALAVVIVAGKPLPAHAYTQADFSSVYESSSSSCGSDLPVNKTKSSSIYATYDCVHLVNTVKGSYVIKSAPSGNTPCPAATVDQTGASDGVAAMKSGKAECIYFPQINANFENPNLSKPALDSTATASSSNGDPAQACKNVATPGLNLDCSNGKNPIYALLQFVANWAIRLLGVLAVLAIVISGIQYIVSQGNPEGVKNAKNRLTNAIIGLILLALMFVILNFLGVTK